MHLLILVILLCFFIFLFALFVLTRDDFVLIRKDVTLDVVFNISFVAFAVSLTSSRILYVILNPSSDFLNPLVFLLFPYFPGLSLLGAVAGGVLFLVIICKQLKLPIGRLIDYFSISFLSSLPIGIIGYFLLEGENLFKMGPIILVLVYTVLFFILIITLPYICLLPLIFSPSLGLRPRAKALILYLGTNKKGACGPTSFALWSQRVGTLAFLIFIPFAFALPYVR